MTPLPHRATFTEATFSLTTMTNQSTKAQIVAAVMRNLQDVLANHRNLAPALTFVVHEAPPPGTGSTAPLSSWLVTSDSVSLITRAGDERTETEFQPWASFSISDDQKRVYLDWQLGFTYGRGFLYEVHTDADGNPVLRNEVATVVS